MPPIATSGRRPTRCFHSDTRGSPWGAHFIFFSFVTQTTLGYGDITPMNDWARALAILQTIFAVFYLAVLIARLVSNYERQDRMKDSEL